MACGVFCNKCNELMLVIALINLLAEFFFDIAARELNEEKN
jgi:hypothetical protein